MPQSNSVSAADIRSNYLGHDKAVEDKQELFGYYVFRPISFYPTAWLINRGISANQASWISIVILAAGCGLLATGSYYAAIVGAILANAWIVLDFVDGNIARYQAKCSEYGAFLDALGAAIAHLLYFSAGLGAYFHPDLLGLAGGLELRRHLDPGIAVILGAWASLAALWIRVVYQKFKNTFQGSNIERYDILGTERSPSLVSRAINIANNIFDLSGLLLPLLLMSVIFRMLDVFLVCVAAVHTGALVYSLIRLIAQATRSVATEDSD